jgi:hypothetical protein
VAMLTHGGIGAAWVFTHLPMRLGRNAVVPALIPALIMRIKGRDANPADVVELGCGNQKFNSFNYICGFARPTINIPTLKYQRWSNNPTAPRFTDQELLTVYLFAMLQGHFKQKAMHPLSARALGRVVSPVTELSSLQSPAQSVARSLGRCCSASYGASWVVPTAPSR